MATAEAEEERHVAESVLSFKISVPIVAAKLSNKSDSDVVVNLFMEFQGLAKQNVILRRRSQDLLNQLTVSDLDFSRIKEELEGKFRKYKLLIQKETFLRMLETRRLSMSSSSRMPFLWQKTNL
jgi:hypothetical protein